MTLLFTNPFSNIIPKIETLVEKFIQKKIHPDILFEMPDSLELFSKNFIIMARSNYQNTGVSSFNNNCISFENLEKSINLKKKIYYDSYIFKCYIAFDVHKLTEIDIDNIAHAILLITGNLVYLNRSGRKHPYFENLLDVASEIDLFENYSEQDKIVYAQVY